MILVFEYREKSSRLLHRLIFLLFFLIACWFGMEIAHEAGHVFAAWCSGATVEQVALLPISRTDTSGVEHPLFVYGAGAVFGTVFPVLLWLTVRMDTFYLTREHAIKRLQPTS